MVLALTAAAFGAAADADATTDAGSGSPGNGGGGASGANRLAAASTESNMVFGLNADAGDADDDAMATVASDEAGAALEASASALGPHLPHGFVNRAIEQPAEEAPAP